MYDETFGDSSAISSTLSSKLAKSRAKVSLSADGGDEQFFGNAKY
ncbi:MAG: asparagine synthase C-terminal domain-containing protein [Candidatus Calescibacterium sp.]|nr:asparagine synthase C-terminal domain-containing protein [Candidatus Calescibacterium sp.]